MRCQFLIILGLTACTSLNPEFMEPRSVSFEQDLGAPETMDLAGTTSDLAQRCSSCPMESYCDNVTGQCLAGCTRDDDCLAGRYCNRFKMQCEAGCRMDQECGARQICEFHKCQIGCRNCGDDGNSCTRDWCDDGECKHTQLPDDANCLFDGNACTKDICKSGQCTHPLQADGTDCPGPGNNRICLSGTCTAPKAVCEFDSSGPGPNNWKFRQNNGQPAQTVTSCVCAPDGKSLVPTNLSAVTCTLCEATAKLVRCY